MAARDRNTLTQNFVAQSPAMIEVMRCVDLYSRARTPLLLVGATGTGYVTLWRSGTPQPVTSSINFPFGTTRSNNAIVDLASGGTLDAQASVGGSGTVASPSASSVVVRIVPWLCATNTTRS